MPGICQVNSLAHDVLLKGVLGLTGVERNAVLVDGSAEKKRIQNTYKRTSQLNSSGIEMATKGRYSGAYCEHPSKRVRVRMLT